MKKMWLLSLLLTLPFVAAQGPLDVIKGVFDKILFIGSLKFIGISGTVPFTRILVWILTFALFLAVMTGLGAGREGAGGTSTAPFKFFGRRQAMIVAAVMATISAVFLPAAAILAVGAGWATAVGLILIGAPIVGLWYVLWNISGKDAQGKALPDTKGIVLLKLLISMLLFWILSAMNHEVRIVGFSPEGTATVAGTMANFLAWALYIVSIMIIYYIIKFFFTSSESAEEADKRWKEGGEALRKAIGKNIEARKKQEEMAQRAEGVKEPQSYLINAVDACQGIDDALSRSARTMEERGVAGDKAEKHLKLLRKNLKRAVRSLRYLRRKERGDIYEFFDNLYSHAGVALSKARDISLPKPDSANWDAEARAIRNHVMGHQGIRGLCGAMIKSLDAFVEHQKTQIAAVERAERQAEERAQKQEAAQQRVQEQAREQEPTENSNLRRRKEARLRGVARARRGR